MVAGLPTDRFTFAGFPPTASKARMAFLQELAPQQATVILYESPKRIHQLLKDAVVSHGELRKAVLCRELTKRFEEVVRGTLAEIQKAIATRDLKGEIVLLLDRALVATASPAAITDAMRAALAEMSLKDAADAVSKALLVPRRDAYQIGLAMGKAR
jgi:16S rRNA (cytidine1402-2'-O)-methyltransferase